MTTTQYLCGRCCSHGGCCILDNGHAGPHDTGYCQWPDEESISRAEADALLLTSGRPEARGILLLQEALEGFLGIEVE